MHENIGVEFWISDKRGISNHPWELFRTVRWDNEGKSKQKDIFLECFSSKQEAEQALKALKEQFVIGFTQKPVDPPSKDECHSCGGVVEEKHQTRGICDACINSVEDDEEDEEIDEDGNPIKRQDKTSYGYMVNECGAAPIEV